MCRISLTNKNLKERYLIRIIWDSRVGNPVFPIINKVMTPNGRVDLSSRPRPDTYWISLGKHDGGSWAHARSVFWHNEWVYTLLASIKSIIRLDNINLYSYSVSFFLHRICSFGVCYGSFGPWFLFFMATYQRSTKTETAGPPGERVQPFAIPAHPCHRPSLHYFIHRPSLHYFIHRPLTSGN